MTVKELIDALKVADPSGKQTVYVDREGGQEVERVDQMHDCVALMVTPRPWSDV